MQKFFSHRGRRLAALALCLLTLTGLLAVSAAAMGSTPVQVTAEVRPSVAILVDGVERTFYDASGKEVHAIYYNGTHYLPVRAIGELMGKNVNWDGSTRTITLSRRPERRTPPSPPSCGPTSPLWWTGPPAPLPTPRAMRCTPFCGMAPTTCPCGLSAS